MSPASTRTCGPGWYDPGRSTAAATAPPHPPGAIPAKDRRGGKCVPGVVDPGPATRRAGAKAGGAHEAGEDLLDRHVDEPRAEGGDEEARRLRLATQLVSQPGVVPQGPHGARMQRQLPALVELRGGDHEHAVVEVHVAGIEANQLTDARPGHLQQADQRLVGSGTQPRRQRAGGRHQRGDVVLGVQEGDRPAVLPGEQAGRWHLGGRIEGLQVAGEAARDREALAQIRRMGLLARSKRPGHCQLRGERRSTRGLRVGDEVAEQPRVVLQLEAEAAADRDVVVDRLLEGAHAAVRGHG